MTASVTSVMIGVLPAALHPLSAAPGDAPWNYDDIIDLLPDGGVTAEAAVLVGLIQREGTLRVLLTRRTDSLRHHAGQVSFPGGRVEADDADAVAAAMREAHEEIGLSAALVAPLGYLDPLITISGFRVLPVVAMIDPAFIAKPDPNEVADVFEVDLDYLMQPEHLEQVAIGYRGRDRHVLQFRNAPQAPEHRIWGVTASILFNLRERLARTALTA